MILSCFRWNLKNLCFQLVTFSGSMPQLNFLLFSASTLLPLPVSWLFAGRSFFVLQAYPWAFFTSCLLRLRSSYWWKSSLMDCDFVYDIYQWAVSRAEINFDQSKKYYNLFFWEDWRFCGKLKHHYSKLRIVFVRWGVVRSWSIREREPLQNVEIKKKNSTPCIKNPAIN